MKDAALHLEQYLPAANATNVTGVLDLGVDNPIVQYEALAACPPELADDKFVCPFGTNTGSWPATYTGCYGAPADVPPDVNSVDRCVDSGPL